MKKNYKELNLTIMQFDSDVVTASIPRFTDDVGEFDQSWLDDVVVD